MPRAGRWVTANSSDQEIIDAINAAGESRHPWRRHDWSITLGANNTRSWVITNDIGRSSRRNRDLLKRLRQMVAAGLLEERADGTRVMPKRNGMCATTYIICNGMPRFRVIPK